jgi:hypothetical protein
MDQPSPIVHYQIRWSGSELDWERFRTRDEAESRAKELAAPEEIFTIEQFDEAFLRCKSLARSVYQ